MMRNQQKAYIFAGISVLMWSTVASAFKLALFRMNFIQVLFYASLISAVSLFITVLVQGKLPQFLTQRKKHLAHSALLGLFNPFIYYLILFKAYALLPAQEAQPLNWTWPIVLSILSAIVMKHKLSLRALAAIFLSFIGVVIISVKGQFTSIQMSDPFGTFLALVSCLFWATYWVLNMVDQRDAVLKLATNFIFGSIYITIVVGLFDRFYVPTWYEFGLLAWIGLFEMGFTFVCWLYALNLSENSARVANIAFLAPFISLIFIHFIVGETILPSSVVGLGLIIGGIVLQTTSKDDPAQLKDELLSELHVD